MFEAYKIGSTFSVKNEVSGPLKVIIGDLMKAQKEADKFMKSLGLIGSQAGKINSTADAIRMLNRQLSIGEGRAARMAASMRDIGASRPPRGDWGMGGFSEGGGRPSGTSLPFYPMLPSHAGGGRGGGGSGNPPPNAPLMLSGPSAGGGRRGPFDSQTWAAMNGGGAVPPGGGGFSPVIIPGGGGGSWFTPGRMMGGYFGYQIGKHAIGATLGAATDYQTEKARFSALGLGEGMNSQAEKFVREMNTYGTSKAENFMLFRDAQTIFRDSGDLHHAEIVAPMLAKMKFANEALYGKGQKSDMEGKFLDMLKVVEMRKGLQSPDEFKAQANMIQQVLTTSGGRVDATQYLNMLKTGGVAAKGLSNQAMYYQMEPIIQEMGGMRVGTGLMSAYSNLALGRTTVQVAKEMKDLGLLDPKHVEYNKIGMIKRILPGGLTGGDQLASSPIDFLEKTLLPAFSKKGITDEKKVLQELGLIFSNRTASQLFSTMYLQRNQIRQGEKMSKGALNIDQANTLAQGMFSGKELEMEKKWRDALNELGTAILPLATKAVEGLTAGLKGFTALIESGPMKYLLGLGGGASFGTDIFDIKEKIDHLLNPLPPGMQPPGYQKNSHIAPRQSQPIHVSSPVYLDGREISRNTTKHQAREAGRAQGGTGRFDGSMSAPRPAQAI